VDVYVSLFVLCTCQHHYICLAKFGIIVEDIPAELLDNWNPPSPNQCNGKSKLFMYRNGYGVDGWGVGVWVSVGAAFFSSPCRPDRLWGPPSLLSSGYWGYFLRLKQPGREAAHSNAEIKNTWLYIYIHSLIRLHGVMFNLLSTGTSLSFTLL
jgi:hypothetical protein